MQFLIFFAFLQLLLKTSAGYHIDLNNTFAVQKQIGWPTLQIQVLQELVSMYLTQVWWFVCEYRESTIIHVTSIAVVSTLKF